MDRRELEVTAELAHLELNDDELESLGAAVSRVVEYFSLMQSVDVSDLEALPLEVAHDAVHGELLCGDRQAFAQFKTAIEDEYDAQRETLRRHQRSVIDRIAEDGLRG